MQGKHILADLTTLAAHSMPAHVPESGLISTLIICHSGYPQHHHQRLFAEVQCVMNLGIDCCDPHL